MDAQPDEMALRVGDDVALAFLNLFAGVKAARNSGFRGLDRLAINNASRGARLTASLLAGDSNKSMVDPLKRAVQ
jgi:hypothetical protein